MKFVIIPIKTFENSKNRLKSHLNDTIRMQLCELMAMDVLNAVLKNEEFDKIIIITKEKQAFSKYTNDKIIIIEENEELGINQAIKFAYNQFNIGKSDAVLILHADTPLISKDDINWMSDKLTSHESIAIIAPSLRKDGTNALLVKPANLIKFQFGKNSYEKHLELLKNKQDLEVLIFENENISLDIDIFEDLIKFNQKKSKTLSQEFLIKEKIKIE